MYCIELDVAILIHDLIPFHHALKAVDDSATPNAYLKDVRSPVRREFELILRTKGEDLPRHAPRAASDGILVLARKVFPRDESLIRLQIPASKIAILCAPEGGVEVFMGRAVNAVGERQM